ncbi:Signal transduction histidine kinase OS=Streptomyces griseomycini OX=66895 GN=FHS37_000362 PE=4 SV=1 [Streptomyces griseomycini]
MAAAVGAALDNVREHAGEQARAWILVEDEPDEVIVTVRDDGPGIPEGRLAQAEGEGRLGVALSIRGRLRDLGGSAGLISVPGQGTEVELKVPKAGNDGTDVRGKAEQR